MRQLSSGRAVFRLDLSRFSTAPDIDTYAAVTMCLQQPAPWPAPRPETPCIQLGLRGSDAAPCLSKPCQGKMAAEVRYSASLLHDGTPGMPESQMMGEGTRPARWLPLGGLVVDLVTEWWSGTVRVSTQRPDGTRVASVDLHQGAETVAFGWVLLGVPHRGIGWAYSQQWVFQTHGGDVELRAFEELP